MMLPGFLLHEDAKVYCMHTGEAQPSVTDTRVKVSGKHITTIGAVYTVDGCQNPLLLGGPCIAVQWPLPALRVRASRLPVLLNTSQATCVLPGTGVIITQTQTRVRGK